MSQFTAPKHTALVLCRCSMWSSIVNTVITDRTCNAKNATFGTIEMLLTKEVDVVFGPICSTGELTVATLQVSKFTITYKWQHWRKSAIKAFATSEVMFVNLMHLQKSWKDHCTTTTTTTKTMFIVLSSWKGTKIKFKLIWWMWNDADPQAKLSDLSWM